MSLGHFKKTKKKKKKNLFRISFIFIVLHKIVRDASY